MKKYLKLFTILGGLVFSNQTFAASEDMYGGCEHGKCNVIRAVLSNGMRITRDVHGNNITGSFSLSGGGFSLSAGDNNKNYIDSLRIIASITSLEIGDEITEEGKATAAAERAAMWEKESKRIFGE